MLKRIAFGLLLAPLLTVAAEAPAVTVWHSSDLKTLDEKQLATSLDAKKLASSKLGDYGNHTAQIYRREADGEAEFHELQADIFVVQRGQATLVTGGKVVGGKTTAPGEIRGISIEGGTRSRIAPGDIVHIPAKTPHQLLLDKGAAFTYFVFKVNAN